MVRSENSENRLFPGTPGAQCIAVSQSVLNFYHTGQSCGRAAAAGHILTCFRPEIRRTAEKPPQTAMRDFCGQVAQARLHKQSCAGKVAQTRLHRPIWSAHRQSRGTRNPPECADFKSLRPMRYFFSARDWGAESQFPAKRGLRRRAAPAAIGQDIRKPPAW